FEQVTLGGNMKALSTNRLLKNSFRKDPGVVAAVCDRRNSITCESTTLIERRYSDVFQQAAKYVGWVVMFLLAMVPLAYAQDAKLKIDHLDKLAAKASEVSEVNLEGPLLKSATKFLSEGESDEDVKKLVSGLKGIYVRSFEFEKEGAYSSADLETIRKQLQAPGWLRIVNVQEKGGKESTEVYQMLSDEKIVGLAILTAEPKELTVVNIVGPVDLAKMGGHFGVPSMVLGMEKPKTK
ncbi:MAG: DUF4252 domain-containing protein, partial [Terriglobia bacterium]